MSLVFSQTSSPYKGIIQQIEQELGMNVGDISGNATRLAQITTLVNLAWDDYMYIALKASGTWQFDDSNHENNYPIIYTNLIQGQRDYVFTLDEENNLILDIYKVAVLRSATETLYSEIKPTDQQTQVSGISEENTDTGVPYCYDKTANGIFLDPPASYTATNGLKVWINREASYFVTTDTTKKPGCPGIHHRYFVLRPALDYARRNNLTVYNTLAEEVLRFEGDEERGVVGSIERYFARRQRDERPVMKHKKILYI